MTTVNDMKKKRALSASALCLIEIIMTSIES